MQRRFWAGRSALRCDARIWGRIPFAARFLRPYVEHLIHGLPVDGRVAVFRRGDGEAGRRREDPAVVIPQGLDRLHIRLGQKYLERIVDGLLSPLMGFAGDPLQDQRDHGEAPNKGLDIIQARVQIDDGVVAPHVDLINAADRNVGQHHKKVRPALARALLKKFAGACPFGHHLCLLVETQCRFAVPNALQSPPRPVKLVGLGKDRLDVVDGEHDIKLRRFFAVHRRNFRRDDEMTYLSGVFLPGGRNRLHAQADFAQARQAALVRKVLYAGERPAPEI